ncbi:hypothetical protein ILYODFUR_037579, partial [Ilyodon furcidens]
WCPGSSRLHISTYVLINFLPLKLCLLNCFLHVGQICSKHYDTHLSKQTGFRTLCSLLILMGMEFKMNSNICPIEPTEI